MLGTYSIDENGDTTLTDYGVYTIEGGELDVRQDDQGRRPRSTALTRRRGGRAAPAPSVATSAPLDMDSGKPPRRTSPRRAPAPCARSSASTG